MQIDDEILIFTTSNPSTLFGCMMVLAHVIENWLIQRWPMYIQRNDQITT